MWLATHLREEHKTHSIKETVKSIGFCNNLQDTVDMFRAQVPW